mmetsp:Transcript_22121/g.54750  ORF Transcript_22121/g.54750 Transcript_22121/m.54750 type:complete len:219 (-) Transcript_22121:612-1268(-)
MLGTGMAWTLLTSTGIILLRTGLLLLLIRDSLPVWGECRTPCATRRWPRRPKQSVRSISRTARGAPGRRRGSCASPRRRLKTLARGAARVAGAPRGARGGPESSTTPPPPPTGAAGCSIESSTTTSTATGKGGRWLSRTSPGFDTKSRLICKEWARRGAGFWTAWSTCPASPPPPPPTTWTPLESASCAGPKTYLASRTQASEAARGTPRGRGCLSGS